MPSTDEKTKPGSYEIHNGWLVQIVNEHTCGAGDTYGHEPWCGMVPLERIEDILAERDRFMATIKGALKLCDEWEKPIPAYPCEDSGGPNPSEREGKLLRALIESNSKPKE